MTPPAIEVFMSCLPALPVEAVPFGEERSADPCLVGRVEAAGRYAKAWPDTGQSLLLGLPRAKLGVGAASGPGSARVLLSAVRSGGADSYFGIEGEAIVPEFQVAEGRVDLPVVGVAAGGGLIDDAWVYSGETAWGLPAVAPALGEATALYDRSDLGLWAGWTAPERWASARVDLTTGEGARFRERNEGKDVATLVSVHPLVFLEKPDWLELSGFYRQGSQGLGSVREHRLGVRASGRTPWADAGYEYVRAWGVAGDAAREASAYSAWAVGHPLDWSLAWARWDRVAELGDAHTSTVRAGLGVDALEGPDAARLLVGWEHTRSSAAWAELAGAEVLERSDALYVQVDVALTVGR